MSSKLDLRFYDEDGKKAICIESAMYFKFPGIEELEVLANGNHFQVSFKKGKYTQEEIETFLKWFRKEILTTTKS